MDTLEHPSVSPARRQPWVPREDAESVPDIEQVFVTAYVDHRAALLRYLRACTRDQATAEDLCQEAYVRLFTELLAGRRPRDPAAWLRRVGRNLMISQARRAAVADRHLSRPPEPGSPDPTARGVLDREAIGSVGRALQRVPLPQRRLLVLAADGLTPAEMSALLGDASAGAIRTRLHRARRLLRGEVNAMDRAA